jgi:3-oxoacyl-[acyl-carrier protein] reductase
VNLGIAGRRAAVAAASQGLGFEVARALAAEGARVAMCSHSRDKIERAAAEIGDAAVPIVADLSTAEGAAAFVGAARDALGGVDILVPNAPGPPAGNFDGVSLDQYEPAFALNCLSTIAMCTEAVPGMRARGWGRVVAITSIAVRQPIADLILSNTARAGVTGFLKTVAREVARDGVTVNSLQPGLHRTARLTGLDRDLDEVARSIPAGALGRPEDFGAVAAFLCSDAARYITGAAIPVDGGAYAGLL